MAAYRLSAAALDLVAAYEADLWDIGQQPDHKVLWGARFFCARIGAPAAFNVLPLTDQLGVNVAVHRFVTWLIATRRLRPTADYLVARRPRLGITLSRHWPGFFAAFMATADALGFNVRVAQTQWAMLGQICALIGVAPERLSHADIDAARDDLLVAAQRHGQGTRKSISTAIFGLEATLFHAGVTERTAPQARLDQSRCSGGGVGAGATGDAWHDAGLPGAAGHHFAARSGEEHRGDTAGVRRLRHRP